MEHIILEPQISELPFGPCGNVLKKSKRKLELIRKNLTLKSWLSYPQLLSPRMANNIFFPLHKRSIYFFIFVQFFLSDHLYGYVLARLILWYWKSRRRFSAETYINNLNLYQALIQSIGLHYSSLAESLFTLQEMCFITFNDCRDVGGRGGSWLKLGRGHSWQQELHFFFVTTDLSDKSFKNWCISKIHLLTQIQPSGNKAGMIIFPRTQ